MDIKRYEDMDDLALDVMREIGSIGTGNAATALSSLLNEQVRMTVPSIQIRGFNEAVELLGEPEEAVAAVMVKTSGEINGTLLFFLKLDFVNDILGRILKRGEIKEYSQLHEMEISALTEVGNIMISSYASALSKLADMQVNLSVPAIAVNMLGGILSVPMIEMGYETDKLMMIQGKLIIREHHHDSTILMLPDIESLNRLMTKLVKVYE